MKKLSFKIGKREIGQGYPVFVIAELSGNHNKSLDRARELVKAAGEAGVDAIKTQTYTPDTLTIKSDKEWFQVGVNPAWKGRTLYDLYEWAYTPWDWLPELKKIAESYGILFFSSVFDETAVDFMEKMNVQAYKIASFELVDIELLKKVAKTGKPVIISRGMASLEEIELALSTLRENGATDIALLHCISSYPAKPEEMNLATISDIQKRFGVVTGLSSHALGMTDAVISIALGASIIEKHFTLRRSDGGPDAAFSLETEELKELVMAAKEPKKLEEAMKLPDAEKILGKIQYGAGLKEAENVVFRRSLFAVKDIKSGKVFTRDNIRCIRPGYGLAPRFLPEILGKKAAKNIERGTPLSVGLIL